MHRTSEDRCNVTFVWLIFFPSVLGLTCVCRLTSLRPWKFHVLLCASLCFRLVWPRLTWCLTLTSPARICQCGTSVHVAQKSNEYHTSGTRGKLENLAYKRGGAITVEFTLRLKVGPRRNFYNFFFRPFFVTCGGGHFRQKTVADVRVNHLFGHRDLQVAETGPTSKPGRTNLAVFFPAFAVAMTFGLPIVVMPWGCH